MIEPDKQARAALSRATLPGWYRHSEMRDRGARVAIEKALDDVKFHYKLTDHELRAIVNSVMGGEA